MKKIIILLLSNLRGIDGIVARFRNSFPMHILTPIVFLDKEGERFGNKYQEVTPSIVSDFSNKFDFTDVDAMFVSFMTEEKLTFIKRAPREVKLIWSIPGGDLYNRYLRYFGYPIIDGENKTLKFFLGKIIRRIPRRIEFNYLINRCAAIVGAKCDYLLIKKYATVNTTKPRHIYAIAYPMEKMLGPLYDKPFVNNNDIKIVVGNSASRTNNHLYALKYLKSISNLDASISLLMSYGDSKGYYRNKVIAAYKRTFGESVSFVTDFVPLDVFNRSLLTVTHYVYGNWRQEAVGNILTAFYLGGKVYLSRYNPLLEDFREKGFVVFCLEEIDESFIIPISDEDKKHNRVLINELYNEERATSLFNEGMLSIIK